MTLSRKNVGDTESESVSGVCGWVFSARRHCALPSSATGCVCAAVGAQDVEGRERERKRRGSVTAPVRIKVTVSRTQDVIVGLLGAIGRMAVISRCVALHRVCVCVDLVERR